MHAQNTRQLNQWLSELKPSEFDYSHCLDNAECGCVAWLVRRRGASQRVDERALMDYLDIDWDDASRLFIGHLYGDPHGRGFSLDASELQHLARARRCLREIAAKHGINLDEPATCTLQDQASREAAFLADLRSQIPHPVDVE